MESPRDPLPAYLSAEPDPADRCRLGKSAEPLPPAVADLERPLIARAFALNPRIHCVLTQ